MFLLWLVSNCRQCTLGVVSNAPCFQSTVTLKIYKCVAAPTRGHRFRAQECKPELPPSHLRDKASIALVQFELYDQALRLNAASQISFHYCYHECFAHNEKPLLTTLKRSFFAGTLWRSSLEKANGRNADTCTHPMTEPYVILKG
jgi:hypothetical protein